MTASTDARFALDYSDVDRLAKMARGHVAVAAWLDEHGVDLPFIPAHYQYLDAGAELSFNVGIWLDEPDWKDATAYLVRLIGGHWDKSDRDDTLVLTQRDHDDLWFEIRVPRNAVCERVVVGSREVTVPAKPAVEATPETVVTEDVVEWRCGSLLSEATR